MDHALISKNPLMNISTQVSSMFSSRGFIILHVIFSSMIYFKIVFVSHVKYETNSPLEKLICFLIEVILVCNISVLCTTLYFYCIPLGMLPNKNLVSIWHM